MFKKAIYFCLLSRFLEGAVKKIAIGDAPQSVMVTPISVNVYRFAVDQPAK
ncbi:MAG: hypothetical protein ACLPY1_07015 [Terracidiphilus sp.]